MERLSSQLLARDFFLVFVWSSRSDQCVISELLNRLNVTVPEKIARQTYVPAIGTWKDLVAVLRDVDFLVASRLHSTILGFVSQKPTVAISFDPKVDWVMEDVGQTESLLQIRDFTAEEVVEALDRMEKRRNAVTEEIEAYQRQVLSTSALQYDTLARLTQVATH